MILNETIAMFKNGLILIPFSFFKGWRLFLNLVSKLIELSHLLNIDDDFTLFSIVFHFFNQVHGTNEQFFRILFFVQFQKIYIIILNYSIFWFVSLQINGELFELKNSSSIDIKSDAFIINTGENWRRWSLII